ncbi:hypothetical protein BDV97DRAFT_290344 [Delphinella strobiligena]|nr:hypothetical protein BDV97DRAFT_290344 [Delphinella strobiligena]
MASSKIYDHPLGDGHHLIKALQPHLPTCIAFYRRLQFQHYTPTSHLFSSLSTEDLREGNTHGTPWIAAYVDRSRRPETEVWMFGTWESHTDQGGDQRDLYARDLIEALLAKIQDMGLDAADGAPQNTVAAAAVVQNGLATVVGKSSATNVGRGEYEGHMANPNIVLFGALHERTVDLMGKMDVLSQEFVGADIPYRKYMFDLSTEIVRDNTLPEDLVWGQLQPEHFSLVKSRTQIPRQDSTLRQLPNLAIFPRDSSNPIAWSFLGPDASLSCLHVETEYRGRRLAKILSAKLFQSGMHTYWQGTWSPDSWAHADVAVDNAPSNGVCKSLNGNWSFHVYWVRVDMAKLEVGV